MKISFLHTAQVHVETFNAIVKSLAPDTYCIHHVAPELLARAQTNGLPDVADETADILAKLAQADAVFCTSSTLGPLVDAFAVTHLNVIRIDRPMMDAACASGHDVLVAICLESTRNTTLTMLNDCANQAGKAITPRLVLCDNAWPFFQAGNTAAFASEVSKSIRAEIAGSGLPDSIILAQASMRVAADQLQDLGIPILSSPLLATQRLLAVAGTSSERSRN
jgi:hypothetical protein